MTEFAHQRPEPPSGPAAALLAIIDGLAAESRPGFDLRATLDSSLERDLGLDSLARVELITRIEDGFSVQLHEDTLSRAETARDLLDALRAAGAAPHFTGKAHAVQAPLVRVEGLPTAASTLVEALEWHVDAHPDRLHVLFYRTPEHTEQLTYAGLKSAAMAICAGLGRRGLVRGQSVAIMLPTCLEFFHCYYGILLAGGVPVPLYPPARLSQLEDHLRRQAGILDSCLAPILITVPEAKLAARFLEAEVASLQAVVTPSELASDDAGAQPVPAALRPEDVAFIQYTSGSTGNPKGVVLTHANLMANIRAWGRAIRMDSTDVVVSWLPLYHDMGLIGTWLGSLYHASLLVLMSPLDFLARPERWLWAIHTHRGTATAAPNFAYELCLRRLHDETLQGLDLSSWRLAANGAEPVSPDTIARFSERFGKYGFRPESMAPVYGLAECTVGLAIPPLGRPPVVDRVQRAAFQEAGRAIPAAGDDPDPLRFVACGHPLPGHQVRIINDDRREVPDRTVGHLEFRGPSATSGYLGNPEETKKLIHGDWLDSGDLAYVVNGDIHITSRAKDMIIRGGRNIYPYELEEAIGQLAGVRKGCVAIFGASDPAAGTERLVVVAETREKDAAALASLRRQINNLAVDLIGTPTDDIVLARPQTVLKTSSGKIRRAATRDLYLRGAIGAPGRGAWLQVARVTWMGLTPGLRRYTRRAAAYGFALRVYAVFFALAPLAWLGAVLAPGRAWSFTSALARTMLRVSGFALSVQGLDNLPRGTPCVAVSNHASYLDGVLILAALREPFGFVAKNELQDPWLARVFLRGLGAQFVERFDVEKSVEDSARLVQHAKAGHSLFVFPEGTLTRASGLMAFRMGAFQVAAEAGIPVVPVTITGTRSVLRDGSWFPHRGPVSVSISPPIAPTGSDWSASVKLRDVVRAEILRHCGEPDLGQ
jgi:1-acyl-sn-glycerol-3-phosphate acyltransferase